MLAMRGSYHTVAEDSAPRCRVGHGYRTVLFLVVWTRVSYRRILAMQGHGRPNNRCLVEIQHDINLYRALSFKYMKCLPQLKKCCWCLQDATLDKEHRLAR